MTRRIATLKIAHELLPDLLHLPIGTKVVGVSNDGDLLNVTVTHGHLREVADGAEVPTTTAAFTSIEQDPIVRFDGWGAQHDSKLQPFVPPSPPPSPVLVSNSPPAMDKPIAAAPRIVTHNGPGVPVPVVTQSPPVSAPIVTGT